MSIRGCNVFFTFLLCSEHICIKDQIDIYLYTSRTYLIVFSYNVWINLIVGQIIQGLIWW